MPTIKILAPLCDLDNFKGFIVMGEMEFPVKAKKYLAPILNNKEIIGYVSILNHKDLLFRYFYKTLFEGKVVFTLKDKGMK